MWRTRIVSVAFLPNFGITYRIRFVILVNWLLFVQTRCWLNRLWVMVKDWASASHCDDATMNDPGQCHDWRRIFSGMPTLQKPLTPPEPFVAQNGWSGSKYWRWNAPQGRLLMKVWPADGPTHDEHLERHRKLKCLSSFQPGLAVPIADQNGNTIRPWFGDLWAELLPWLEGTPILVKPSETVIRQSFQALARLHIEWKANSPTVQGPSPAVSNRLNQLRKLKLAHLLEPDSRIWYLSGQAKPMIGDQFMEICKLAKALTDDAIHRLEPFEDQIFAQQTVLRDARPDHFLMIGESLSGIIDFGAIGTDSIAVDLARLTSDWFPGDQTRFETALTHYSSVSCVTPQELGLIPPLALAGAILGGLAWVDLHFRKRRTSGRDNDFQHALSHAYNRLKSHVPEHSIAMVGL